MSTERVLTERTTDETCSPVVDPTDEDGEAVTLTLDRNPGSGSLTRQEGWVDEVTSEHGGPNDGRYETRTTFYARDADSVGPSQKHRDPEDRRSWADLAKWNDGMWDSERSIKNFEADVRRWTQTFCNFLNIPDYQYQRVEYIVTRVNLEDFKQHRLPAEKIILATISLVVDAETNVEDITSWDIDDWIIYDDEFEELMDDVNMDRSELWTARKLVHNHTDYFSDD